MPATTAAAKRSAAPVADLASLTRLRPFAVLAPHPDDETLGCGGLISRATRLGVEARVIVLTDGGASHVAPGWTTARLGATRRAETVMAVEALGLTPDHLHLLDRADGALDDDARTVELVADILARNAIETLFVTDPADSHPDHRAAFRIACRLVAEGTASGLVTYPVSQCFEGGDLSRFEHLTVATELQRKMAAIACHATQLGTVLPPGSGFSLTTDDLGPFRAPVERYRPLHGLPSAGMPEAAAHFDRMFEASPDPWNYGASRYERDRHARTVAVLGGRRFQRAWEAGTAAGHLAEQLLAHCDALVATDASAAAVDRALARLGQRAEVRHMALPDAAPDGPFDLILLSDMLYYLGFDGVVATARVCRERLAPGGVFIVVSWLGNTEAALTGIESAELFRACRWPGLELERSELHPGFRLDRYRLASA